MANQEQIEILKQGVDDWNIWREENRGLKVDLVGADLQKIDLESVDLRDAILFNANLVNANLRRANLSDASLFGANLYEVDLRDSLLAGTDFTKSDLRKSDLGKADFRYSILRATYLNEVNFTDAVMIGTILVNVDLTKSIGLETIHHHGPSHINIETIQNSKGRIPFRFLRGCGLSDIEIEFAKLTNPDLSSDEITDITYKIHELRAGGRSIQVSPLFISYSHADNAFVEKMEGKLNELGIRFWRDVHHATSGPLEKQIDRAIRHNPTVLLVFSKNSIKSDWVEHEVRTARELEKELGRDTLCPVALDDSWKSSSWPKRIMEQVMEYNILDFSEWEDDSKFEGMFRRLIDGLELF